MKKILLFLLLVVVALSSCKKDLPNDIDISFLQKRLDSDPEVIKMRNAFHSHSRVIASYTPEEFRAMQSKVLSCGFYAGDAPMTELEKCLEEVPRGDEFVQGEKSLREYNALKKSVEQRYPELLQIDRNVKLSILVPFNQGEAMKILSDYQSRKK